MLASKEVVCWVNSEVYQLLKNHAAVYSSVFTAAVMPERAGRLDEPDIYEEGSRWHLQGKLSGSDVEKFVVLFQLYVPVFARDQDRRGGSWASLSAY